MATVLLSTVGAGIGSAIGGQVFGLSMAAVGRFAGAAIGQTLDQRSASVGGEPMHAGRVERMRLTGAGEGSSIPYLVGRVRTSGHIIWASQFHEAIDVTGGTPGSKGMPPQPEVRSYRYSINLAVALCHGEISAVTRLWADGVEIGLDDVEIRLHRGTETQKPDPTIEAIEGKGNTPAYRGLAYVVFKNLQLAQFGNRIPQFSFEVCRSPSFAPDADQALAKAVRAVAVIPGTGEYALATTPVTLNHGMGRVSWSNRNTPSGLTDFATSLNALNQELPDCNAASLVVSWFGDDLRCASCNIQPKVEQNTTDGDKMPWFAGGISRRQAALVPKRDGSVVYGGTPSDGSVIEAIKAMSSAGKKVMFYPFVLMDQIDGNGKSDPYSDAQNQPPLPWRGRITLNKAPGVGNSVDGSSQATRDVEHFFGTARPSDFGYHFGQIRYTGPQEWSYRRFILHYAYLCKQAGGVDSFCIGSEMRGLTQIRGLNHSFPAVSELIKLANDVRSILGAKTKIGYGADWSEYFGYNSHDGNRYFHLDPLWASANIDFIGIDNYMPLADWRDDAGHADAAWDTIHNLEYLRSNIEGGEGYDWYYASEKDRDLQNRTAIVDGAHNEHWVWRYKDIRGWWSNTHHNRIDGVRQAAPTNWVPKSKPIWFTELGCSAINKGANQPNRFLDPKSSESGLPYYSNALRDDLMQQSFLTAVLGYWADVENNPVSDIYGGSMIDTDHVYIWAWDARPYPWFPNATSLWSDGGNYQTGHWLNGRATHASLQQVVAELCEMAGLRNYDVSRLFGVVRGFHLASVPSGRALLEPLSKRFNFDVIERDGQVVFVPRLGGKTHVLNLEKLVLNPEMDHPIETRRTAAPEISGRVRLLFEQADADFSPISEEVSVPHSDQRIVSDHELPIVMTRSEARETLEHWLAASRVGRESIRFALPLSERAIGVGDKIIFDQDNAREYRVDQVENGPYQMIHAICIDQSTFTAAPPIVELTEQRLYIPSVPVLPIFVDVPNIASDDRPTAPYVAVTSDPWTGPVAVYASDGGQNFRQELLISQRSVIGRTLAPFTAKTSALEDRGIGFEVELGAGQLTSISSIAADVGYNMAAIGDPVSNVWEVIQFRNAELIGPNKYRLSNIKWGLKGTDTERPNVWEAGATFVLLDRDPTQLALKAEQRDIERIYRVGPAARGPSDPVFTELAFATKAKGLRPLSPVHVRSKLTSSKLVVSWVRRGRIDADTWFDTDIPLGEEREEYIVRVLKNSEHVLTKVTQTPECAIAMDELNGLGYFDEAAYFEVEIAQISASYGTGLSTKQPLG